ncbi:HNH endonuclease family protein [Rhodococcus sp. HNM0569]|uniref:HNH endonuclease family protein n=1 Tax=Rhodococcus sp. HNM0569 TaxID=2716340 RepID=UPI00146EAB18|nr:HNH endonuclease family protein [Rhodococcus sp. HNM0569]NLU84429.1 HNH endonuclease [Rhodococcus sp. HNM0569]
MGRVDRVWLRRNRVSVRTVFVAAAAGVVAALAGGWLVDQATVAPAPGSPTAEHVRMLLASVDVVAARPRPGGYSRGCGSGEGCVFGPAWSDAQDAPGGHDGCDTRNNVLAQTLTDVSFRSGTGDCIVDRGVLADPYSGTTREFDRSEARAVQIDHVFPLAAAWDLGASQWPLDRRMRFANDVAVNLLAVGARDNQDKGDGTPSDWLPPAPSMHCFYAGKYLTVALAYDLPVTEADHAVLARIADRC